MISVTPILIEKDRKITPVANYKNLEGYGKMNLSSQYHFEILIS